ncbi:MAG: phage holin family protein [Armatimonadota bacterium]
MGIIIRWIVYAIILWIVVGVGQTLGLPVKLHGAAAPFIVVFLLGFANATVRPLVKLFLWPLNCLTFGLLGFFINVLIVYILDLALADFDTGGFVGALYISVAMSILGGVANSYLKSRQED